jgi:hypothetical protein
MRDAFLAGAAVYADAAGEEVTYRVLDDQGAPVEELEIRAVVEDEFEVVQSGDVRISSKRPEIYVTLESFEGSTHGEPREDDEVDVRGGTFEVATPKPDGQGGVFLVLKSAG